LTREEAEQAEKVRNYMRLAEEQMATVTRIAAQTLGFARSTATPRPFDLVQVAEAALRIHQRTIETKKVHVVRDHPDALVVAPVHTGEMLQVISNLIVNALDALPAHGTLHLRLSKREGKVHIVIADNGYGIRAEHSERVFEPFFTTKEGQGTGLGLALSKRIVERHRGKLRMRSSVRPGRNGTTFRISLQA
jgi:signal transduction histidine kinase